jgi:sugar transferase (PEP-CTERM/EpsH1 system associated)
MRILIITDYLPYPPVTGDLQGVYNRLRRIAKQHEVSLVGFLESPDETEGVSHLQKFCYRVETANLQHRSRLRRLPRMLRYFLGGTPPELEFLYSEELVNKIRQLVSEVDFDIVQIEQSRMALYLKILPPNKHFKRILFFHNIASFQYNRISRVERNLLRKMRAWLHGQMMRRWEPRYAERFDCCITVSELDRQLLITTNPRLRVDVVNNGIDTKIYRPLVLEELKPILLLVGSMSYAPNADSAVWFCEEMLPLIRSALGEVQVWIVGLSPPPEVIKLSGNGVHVTGRVEDVLPYYSRSTVCVVPLRAGGGTRGKILEAMALGRPVVSTSIGCEGLDAVANRHLLVADDPQRFAEKTVRLLIDRELYQRIITEARKFVLARYDWDLAAKKLLDVYSEITTIAGTT